MPRPIITLTTDFGVRDHFVGAMKGAILSIAPGAEIVDITHEVNSFEIAEGAFALAEAYRYFPKKTVHVAVVDPGVGSARRPILVQGGGHSFVAPDNGILSLVLAREDCKVRHITADRYFRKPVSQTFHGRDVFAPVAAHLASGVAASRIGKLIQDPIRLSLAAVQQIGRRAWAGAILSIDRFGNLITNLPQSQFPGIGSGQVFELVVGLEHVTQFVKSYAEANSTEACVIVGSSGLLEVCLNQANAAKRLGVGVGAPVELTLW